MRLKARLGRLEQRLIGGKGGCRTCRERRRYTALITAQQAPDGTVVLNDPEPEPCPSCGEVPEHIIVVIEEVVASHDEVAQAN
jgi:hypothetical protein